MVFILRLVHFIVMTLFGLSLVAAHLLVRKSRAKELQKCENLKVVIPGMAKDYILPHSDGREFAVPATLPEFEKMEKKTKQLPHCCGLCLYRFREEAWRNRGVIKERDDDEDEETESDGQEEANVWQGED